MTTTTERHPSLGKKMRDSITGYEGIAVARTEYLSGCFHLDLERAGKEGKPEHEWFDEERLKIVDEAIDHSDTAKKRSPGEHDPGFRHP